MFAELPATEAVSTATVLADLLARRRSVRQLRGGELTREGVARILGAAEHTPAAFNSPPWRVVVVHDRRDIFWDLVEAAFRGNLEGARLDRYLARLEGFRTGAGAVLVLEDCAVVAEMQAANSLSHTSARTYVEQGLGMVQLSIWLAVVAEGMATSLQHWEDLVEDAILGFLGLPPDRFRLVATMPLGHPAETPEAREGAGQSMKIVKAVEGACHPTT